VPVVVGIEFGDNSRNPRAASQPVSDPRVLQQRCQLTRADFSILDIFVVVLEGFVIISSELVTDQLVDFVPELIFLHLRC
jgi:hypothetical protein